ncbi:MAG: DUF4126 domain-containing protein [Betaproteobacteria bacterium]|nr:DUF4126 domain-containing protein [Betaproteobacteria bacterium]
MIQSIGLAAGLAWASGFRLYVALFLTGVLAHFGLLELPASLALLTHPVVLAASGTMLVAEFLADKIPGFDSLWDAVHTFIRIPAGAILAAGSLGSMDPAYIAAAAILGGVIASTSHATKAGSRALINTSPEPFSNWAASLTEDLLAPAGLAIAFKFPLLFLALLAVFLVVAMFLIRFLVKSLRALLGRLGRTPTAASSRPPP